MLATTKRLSGSISVAQGSDRSAVDP